MKQELVRIGPLSVAINAEDLAYYSSGVWDPSNCDPTALDHGMCNVYRTPYMAWLY